MERGKGEDGGERGSNRRTHAGVGVSNSSPADNSNSTRKLLGEQGRCWGGGIEAEEGGVGRTRAEQSGGRGGEEDEGRGEEMS